MAIVRKHSTFIPGAVEFAKWADSLEHVDKVVLTHIRTIKIKRGSRDPKFRADGNAVETFYYSDGALQVMYIFAVHPMTPVRLERYLANKYEESKQRGGCGMSPKDPVELPAYIERQLAAASRHHGEVQATPVAVDEQEVEPTMAASPASPAVKDPIVLSARLAEAYAYLLSLAPDKSADSFELDGITGLLKAHYQDKATTWHYSALVSRGLVIPGEVISGSRRPVTKRSTVLCREFMISEQESGRWAAPATAVAKKRSVEPTSKARSKPEPKSKRKTDGVLDHFEFYRRHLQVLEDWNRRSRELARRGYTIHVVDGEPGLVRIKK